MGCQTLESVIPTHVEGLGEKHFQQIYKAKLILFMNLRPIVIMVMEGGRRRIFYLMLDGRIPEVILLISEQPNFDVKFSVISDVPPGSIFGALSELLDITDGRGQVLLLIGLHILQLL